MKLELACFNKESARIGARAGVNRIELCNNYLKGGLTPKNEDFLELRKEIELELFLMIRPREGNFDYSDEEFKTMKNQINQFKSLGANGFVFGVLSQSKRIDKKRNIELIELAYPFPCTFHRAFDEVIDMEQALEDVISCGFSTLLTSGLKTTAFEGKENLRLLVNRAKDRIVIMPGGGLRSNNIMKLINDLHFNWVHSSAIIGKGEVADENEVGLLKELNYW